MANNNGSAPFTMGVPDASVNIPGVMVSQTDGATIKAAANSSTTIRLNPVQPLMRDGDLDSDIVWHEYGHGLTWRMIGKMSGPLAGAIGEGMSDVLALIANEDDRVGRVLLQRPVRHPLACRTTPTTAPTATSTVRRACTWTVRCTARSAGGSCSTTRRAGIDKSVLLADLVDGMNYTPREPAYEDMRDGILAGLAASGNDERACMVWDAFAEYGVGVGADGIAKGKVAIVTESFDVPAGC